MQKLLGRPINKQLENCKSTKNMYIYTALLRNTNNWQCADMWNACAVWHIKATLGKCEGKYCYIAY